MTRRFFCAEISHNKKAETHSWIPASTCYLLKQLIQLQYG